MPNEPQDFEVILAGNDFVKERWADIEHAVREAFGPARYSDPSNNIGKILQYISDGFEGRLRDSLGHALAVSGSGEVIGGIFCVPTRREPGETDCDAGYVFTSPHIGGRTRLKVINLLMSLVFDTMRAAGFERAVTGMATMAGTKSLGPRYFVHAPTPDKPNRWVRELQ